MTDFIASHKALLATIAAAVLAASKSVPSPYADYLLAASIVLAALSGGIQPIPKPR